MNPEQQNPEFLDNMHAGENKLDVKAAFLEPFDPKEVEDNWTASRFTIKQDDKSLIKRAYKKQWGDYAYYIDRDIRSSGDEFVSFSLQAKDGDPKMGEIIVARHLNSYLHRWDMEHRLINTKGLGITGTEFWEKTEQYLQLIHQLGLVNEDAIIAASSQPPVSEWLLKNGFDFATERSREEYKHYQLHPGQYSEVSMVNADQPGTINDHYVIKKSALNNMDVNPLIKKMPGGGIGIVISSFNQMKNLPGLLRCRFEKKL